VLTVSSASDPDVTTVQARGRNSGRGAGHFDKSKQLLAAPVMQYDELEYMSVKRRLMPAMGRTLTSNFLHG